MFQNMHPFVDRQEAIEQFQELIDFEHPVDKPFLQFYGMGGIGKSFLIQHLKETYLKDIPIVHIVFEPGASDYSYYSFIRQIMRALRPKVSDPKPFQRFKEKSERWLDESKMQVRNIENTLIASGEGIIDMGMGTQNTLLERLQTETRNRITEEFLDTVSYLDFFGGSKTQPLWSPQRLSQHITDLQQQYDLLSQKLSVLERDKILETRSEERFRLEHRITEFSDERQQVEQRLKELETQLATKPQNEDDHVASDQTEHVACCPLLIILDAVENLLPEMQVEKETPDYAGWLINFLLQLSACLPTVRVLFAGRNELTYDSLTPKCRTLKLFHLPEGNVAEYLKQLGIRDEGLIEAIYRLTEGYSLSVSMIGDLWQDAEDNLRAEDLDTEDFRAAYRNKLVPELLMRRIMERAENRLQPLLKGVGLFRYFTYQILKDTLFPDLREDDFLRLTKYTFISKTGKHYQYHAVLRRLITEAYLEQDPNNFHRNCTTIYHYFAGQKSDERFYYGIYGQVEGIFKEWRNTCYQYYYTWQTEKLKILVDIIGKIRQTFSEQEQAAICSVKGGYSERLYQWDQVLDYYRKSEQIFIKVNDQASLGWIYFNIGRIYFNKGEWNQALDYCRKSEQILSEVNNNKAELGRTYRYIGWIYSNKGEWNQALDYCRKSEQIFSDMGNQVELGWTYRNIGWVYSNKGEWDKALDYCLKSEQIHIKVGDQAGLGWTYFNIGRICGYKGEWDLALDYYRKSERIFLAIDNQPGLGWTYLNIGRFYNNKGEWDLALDYYRKSEQISIEVGDQMGLGTMYSNFAMVYYYLNDKRAIQYIEQSVAIFQEIGAKHELEKALEWQKKIYDKLGNGGKDV